MVESFLHEMRVLDFHGRNEQSHAVLKSPSRTKLFFFESSSTVPTAKNALDTDRRRQFERLISAVSFHLICSSLSVIIIIVDCDLILVKLKYKVTI